MIGTIFAASWHNGLFVITDDAVRHELADQSVRGLCADGDHILAIIGGRQLCRRSAEGHWETLATSDAPLSCVVATGDAVLVGSDDAQVLRLGAAGTLQPLPGFAQTEGRDRWYAGTAVIDGRVIGPPLGVRSIAATCNGAAFRAPRTTVPAGTPRWISTGMCTRCARILRARRWSWRHQVPGCASAWIRARRGP
jgi:hypothetical protein